MRAKFGHDQSGRLTKQGIQTDTQKDATTLYICRFPCSSFLYGHLLSISSITHHVVPILGVTNSCSGRSNAMFALTTSLITVSTSTCFFYFNLTLILVVRVFNVAIYITLMLHCL